MTVQIAIRTANWQQAVADDARMTQGLAEGKPLTLALWEDMLHAEHSPIRSLELSLTWPAIPYWVTAHLDRHHVGVQPFTRSQRPDSAKPVGYDRNKAPQDALVQFRMVVNIQALINISRRRLCMTAKEETRAVWGEVKDWLEGSCDPFMRAIGKAMMTDCEYRGGVCHMPRTRSCGKYPHWGVYWGRVER